MSEVVDAPRTQRILDPIDGNSEVLFGLSMVLTFTGALSVATAGRDGVRTMRVAAATAHATCVGRCACRAPWPSACGSPAAMPGGDMPAAGLGARASRRCSLAPSSRR
jgi:hypothetical protein